MISKVLKETTNMTREEWLECRREGLGGSDAAAACSVSRWRSQLELWMEKKGYSELRQQTDATYWGSIMEPIIREEFSKRTGMVVKQVNCILQHPNYDFMLANLDGLVDDPERGVGIFEAKTANAYTADAWEEEVPDEYLMQLHHYFAVTGLRFAYCAVLIGGNTFKYKLIERDESIINMLVALELKFWQSVQQNNPPVLNGSKACSQLLNKLYPSSMEKDLIQLPEEAKDLISQYEAASNDEKAAADRKEEAANKLKAMIGDNDGGVIDNYKVTWMTIESDRFDTKQLKAELPEIYEKYINKTSYRRFTIK